MYPGIVQCNKSEARSNKEEVYGFVGICNRCFRTQGFVQCHKTEPSPNESSVRCKYEIYITYSRTTLSFWLTLLLGNKKNVFKDIYFDSIRQVFVS